jgi:hypothetical protein
MSRLKAKVLSLTNGKADVERVKFNRNPEYGCGLFCNQFTSSGCYASELLPPTDTER